MLLAPSWLHVDSCWQKIGSMLAHVGKRLAHVGKRLAHGASGWPQDGSMLAQVGLQTPKMATKGSQYEPTWPQDGAKMASKSTILRSNCSFSRFSKICEKPKENQWFFKVRGGLKRSKIDKISIKFESILEPPASCASRGLKISSRSPQDGLLEATWSQHAPNLGPSWLK